LRVGSDHIQAGLNGVAVGDGFDQMQDRENAYAVVDFGGIRVSADVQRPAVDDASKVAFVFDTRLGRIHRRLRSTR
jgi:hypothetical protein